MNLAYFKSNAKIRNIIHGNIIHFISFSILFAILFIIYCKLLFIHYIIYSLFIIYLDRDIDNN